MNYSNLPFYDEKDVNHPDHYETNGIECIDAMIASQGTESVKEYCLCNAFKYIWRCKHKHQGLEDIEKAIWYLRKYVELSSSAKEYGDNYSVENINKVQHNQNTVLI